MKTACVTKQSAGFTLVEMMTVMAIVAIIAALGVPAFRGIASSDNLFNSATVMSGLMNQARIYAISHNTQTAVYLCTSWQGNIDRNYRAAAAYAYNFEATPPGWTQISKWETLPQGVIFAPTAPFNTASSSTSGTYYALDNTLLNSSTISVNGQSVTFSEICFNSLGAAIIPTLPSNFTPLQIVSLRLVPGVINGFTTKLTSNANFIDVKTDGLAGRVVFVQPSGSPQ